MCTFLSNIQCKCFIYRILLLTAAKDTALYRALVAGKQTGNLHLKRIYQENCLIDTTNLIILCALSDGSYAIYVRLIT